MTNIVGIIDCGLGNISSVIRLVEICGATPLRICDADSSKNLNKLILPGVGAFDAGISALRERGLSEFIISCALSGKVDVLGICLGMQLLCRSSDEGQQPGLGLIEADVTKFRFSPGTNLKIPHMGWNVVNQGSYNPLIPDTQEEIRFYFVHSYHVVPDDPSIVIGTAYYGENFCAAFQKNNLFGVQFHPEKSHRFGKDLIKRFVDL